MPVEVHGVEARKTLPMRRIEKVLEDDDIEDLINKELQKVSKLKLLSFDKLNLLKLPCKSCEICHKLCCNITSLV